MICSVGSKDIFVIGNAMFDPMIFVHPSSCLLFRARAAEG